MRTAKTRADGEVSLPVIGSIEAGARTPSRLQPRQAARVQTGAPMPTLADAVLPLRWTDGGEARVTVLRGVRSGAYVRRTGEDVQPGDVAVRAGTIIGAAQVGLLAAVGRERVLVHPRPRLSVMCVGGELVDIARTPGNGQVYDVNSYALAAAGRDAGAEVTRVGIVDTDPKELREVVEGQTEPGRGGGDRRRRWRRRGRKRSVGAWRSSARWRSPASRCIPAPCRASASSAGGRAGVPAACQPGQRAGGVRGDGAAADPAVAGQACSRCGGSCRPARCRRSASVAGRKGYLRGQLMRDQDTGEYLVQALGGDASASSHLLATLAEANCLVIVPARPNRSAPARSSTLRSSRSAADSRDRHVVMNLLAFEFYASGLAAAGRSAACARRGGAAASGPAARRGPVEPYQAGRPRAPGAVGTGHRRGLG